MANGKKVKPIHLTNRTAISLRKTAQRVRSAWLIAMCIFTMLATVLAVYLGFSWLPAVPLTLLAAGAIITLMMLISRSQYLLLISQAICTEASSRQMEEQRLEQNRRSKAIEQLALLRADVREAEKKGVFGQAQRSEESLLFDLLTGREPSEEEIRRQRFTEEDEEMYAASYHEDQSYGEDKEEEDEDLLPKKKSKKTVYSKQEADELPTGEQNTRVMKAIVLDEKQEKTQEMPRRRRRGASVQTAPLQLIRTDKAQ